MREEFDVFFGLFISWFLHQTTTAASSSTNKPWLFISWFLHQTTTCPGCPCAPALLFISWFLHQTTTYTHGYCRKAGCLSLDSYIKPQRQEYKGLSMPCCLSLDSYIKPQRAVCHLSIRQVVYLLIPTSNHNAKLGYRGRASLFISWFLHQTTTALRVARVKLRCLSLDSYIKPQRIDDRRGRGEVVYLLIPTSNHNCLFIRPSSLALFISWFLHQTTTQAVVGHQCVKLFISWFLHQTTTVGA